MAQDKKVLTPFFVVSYPKLFKPELNKLNNKLEHSLVALFKKGEDLSALKKAAQDELQEFFGARLPDLIKSGRIKTPFRDQGEKEYTDEATGKRVMPQGMEKGAIFFTLRSKQKPGVLAADGKTEIVVESDLYAGCWARASVAVNAYEKGANVGVNFYLRHIQKYKDGDPLGSRTKPQDDFAPIEVPAEAGGSGPADATSIFG